MGENTKIHDLLYGLILVHTLVSWTLFFACFFVFQRCSAQYPTCDSVLIVGYRENTTTESWWRRTLDSYTDVTHYDKVELEVEKDGYTMMAGNKWSSYRRARRRETTVTYYFHLQTTQRQLNGYYILSIGFQKSSKVLTSSVK